MIGFLLKLFISFVIFNLSFVIVQAQLQGQAKIDSLLKELPKAKQDTNYVNLLNSLTSNLYSLNPEEGIKYGKLGLKISKDINWLPGKLKIMNSMGVVYAYGLSNYELALDYHFKALELAKQLKDTISILTNKGNIGSIYSFQSNYNLAMEYLQEVVKLSKKINDKGKTGRNLTNIGNIYNYQGNNDKALEYYIKALKIAEELNEKKSIAINLSNLGVIYKNKKDFKKAQSYYTKALEISEEIGDNISMGICYGNIAQIYSILSDYPKAFEFYNKALKNDSILGHKRGIATNLGNIGLLYFYLTQDSVIKIVSKNFKNQNLDKKYNLKQALKYTLYAVQVNNETARDYYLTQWYNNLNVIYKEIGDFKNAYKYQTLWYELKDSIFSLEKQKEFAKLEVKQENELKDREIKLLQIEKKASILITYFLYSGIFVLVGAFILSFNRYRVKKKLSEALEKQKSIVEEKNEEIYASMTYASTIQNAILPWESTLKNAFSDIFIFYKPKDIVSGDSYWFQEVDGIKFLAVIDCTGHGIPGAMLTVIASTALDDAVLGKRLSDTGEILTYMNDKVTEVLNQRLVENKIRDGMEVALIAIHNDKVQFSGAGRPLYMKNGTMEIIKTDKRGIAGQTENDEYQFSSIQIEKSENLMLYLASDGYADQMNENSKKYSTKRFVALLDSISEKPIPEQQEILEDEFNNHKGSRSQIDDVTILGVKL